MSRPDHYAGTSRSATFVGWCMGLLAAAAVALAGTNIYLHRTNLALQNELDQRQQFINESIRLGRLNTELVQALATLAAQTEDAAIRDLLASHGITYTVNPPAGAAATEGTSND